MDSSRNKYETLVRIKKRYIFRTSVKLLKKEKHIE